MIFKTKKPLRVITTKRGKKKEKLDYRELTFDQIIAP